MVFDGWGVARNAAGRAHHGNDQFHRALRSRARRGVSFGACGGVGRGVVGSMAPPAVAVLGNVAAGDVHVRVNNLGTVSLRGGRYRWNSDGNARLRDRQMDHEDARRIGGRSVNCSLAAERENAGGAKPAPIRADEVFEDSHARIFARCGGADVHRLQRR
jgi:hypothetical protein